MRIVDTSNGPAIEDDGYIILPTDSQGLLHVATLDPGSVNGLLAEIAGYVSSGAEAVTSQIHVDDEGSLTINHDEAQDVLAASSRMASAAGVLNQALQTLVSHLAPRPEPTLPPHEEPFINFPVGYKFAVLTIASGLSMPVGYYPELELIPESIRRGTLTGGFEIFTQNGELPTDYRALTPDEATAGLPPASAE